jgi:hypothetical protein
MPKVSLPLPVAAPSLSPLTIAEASSPFPLTWAQRFRCSYSGDEALHAQFGAIGDGGILGAIGDDGGIADNTDDAAIANNAEDAAIADDTDVAAIGNTADRGNVGAIAGVRSCRCVIVQ